MTTISVPLPEELVEAINNLIAQGIASNKADLIRRAVQQYVDDQAVEAILKASKEPSLEGDLRTLLKKV